MFRKVGVLFSTFTQWQAKKSFFSSELAVFRGHFSISLAVFRGGLQISSSRMGNQLYGELSSGHVTVHEWVQFLKDKLVELDEHVLVIVLIKLIHNSSILSLGKLNLCSSRHKIRYIWVCWFSSTNKFLSVLWICSLAKKYKNTYKNYVILASILLQ